ncbi:MAG: quinate 5-dehydrogenase [Chloroflexi bacterium HGW-Chloroflexi-3]|nr:MAG: quinate 5-dehydrogenase [Chloroflexi bacterium HGW-Chloroflexi-3]
MNQRAVSVSIGSATRDKAVELELFGKTIQLERIGTDGDMKAAAQMYRDLDGKVGALGMGGALLGFLVDQKWYEMESVKPLVRDVKITPVVDGTGLKSTLERKAAAVVEPYLQGQPKRVFQMSGVDRYGLSSGFMNLGYESIFGDLMFGLGISIPVHDDAGLKRLAKLLVPLIAHMPFSWLYPIGEKQEVRTPKFTKYFEWATVISGDCHYITKYMPERMDGKIIVTNTTTPKDREIFKQAGVRLLVTTTPMLDGRSFGTNMMEAGIVTAKGYTEAVKYPSKTHFERMEAAIQELNLSPQVQEL